MPTSINDTLKEIRTITDPDVQYETAAELTVDIAKKLDTFLVEHLINPQGRLLREFVTPSGERVLEHVRSLVITDNVVVEVTVGVFEV